MLRRVAPSSAYAAASDDFTSSKFRCKIKDQDVHDLATAREEVLLQTQCLPAASAATLELLFM
jgi:hypothetical protein